MTANYDLANKVAETLYNSLAPNYEIRNQDYNVATDAVVKVVEGIGKDLSDGHHTFRELYRYRLLYNSALFNEWSKLGLYETHKSRFHHDGSIPFGDPKWFIVVAQLPTGQISNHYRMDDWKLFQIKSRGLAAVYDGHTPAEAADRLEEFLRPPVGDPSD